MNPQPYGPTGATTTKIGLGGGYLTACSFADGVATVRRALDLGIRYFDTSPSYGRGASQAVLGEALDGVAQDYLLATKVGYFAERSRYHSRVALLTQFEESLRILRRDHVDTLQLHEADYHHWWSTNKSAQGRMQADAAYDFNHAPALETLRELRAQGRCRFIGISGNTADNMGHVLAQVDVDTVLLAYNYDLVRRDARKILSIAQEKGCVRLVGGIIRHGLISPQPELLETPPDWLTPALAARFRHIYALQRESGLSLLEMGVRYMTAQRDVDTVIIGAKCPAEIEECVRAAEKGPLPPEMVQVIESGVG